jgi:hypothetical protein
VKYFLLILALSYTGCSTPKAAPPATDTAAPTIRCNEHPLPEFSLAAGETSSEAAVCDCIWSHLSEQDRQAATNVRNGITNKASITKSFPIRFGQAIATCTSAAP